MSAMKLAHDRWTTLCALEVLKLIADQMEKHGSADPEDINVVLLFLREIAHSGLDNTEKRLLLPFLEFEIGDLERSRLGATLENHRRVGGLFDELERCHRSGQASDFVCACRSYAGAFGDLIFEEDQFLPALIPLVSENDRIQQVLEEFERAEEAIAGQARSSGGALRRLETKYISPHCV